MHEATLHYTALRYTSLHSTTLHCTKLHYIARHLTVLNSTALTFTSLKCTLLNCTALPCTVLNCIFWTSLHYNILCWTVMQSTDLMVYCTAMHWQFPTLHCITLVCQESGVSSLLLMAGKCPNGSECSLVSAKRLNLPGNVCEMVKGVQNAPQSLTP